MAQVPKSVYLQSIYNNKSSHEQLLIPRTILNSMCYDNLLLAISIIPSLSRIREKTSALDALQDILLDLEDQSRLVHPEGCGARFPKNICHYKLLTDAPEHFVLKQESTNRTK